MNIVGVMALSSFPYWRQSVEALMEHCDKVYFRFDGRTGNPEIITQLESVCGDKFGKCFITNGWSFPEWREECLRLVADDKPDVVLCPDQDEIFDEDFPAELQAFIASEKKGMMFNYHPLETYDGRQVNSGEPYPENSHMKVFKWEEGISYYPYHGDAKISRYVNPACHWQAQSKIHHYCCYTQEMEKRKHFRNDTIKGKARKAVTLIGFGPTSKHDMEAQGEVWSLNNCYDALSPTAMKLCTRIFEMHQLDKRKGKADIGRDGKPHLWHLDKCGKEGRRIICIKPDPQITNSEAFPLMEMEAKLGVSTQWRGTPSYMLAMAIAEGYTNIRIYGLDQMDWEHTLQRESMLFWQGYALGRGIQLSGALTAVKRNQDLLGRYGYDYGPEFCEKQQKALWDGHPMEIKYKIPSRVVSGDLYDGGSK